MKYVKVYKSGKQLKTKYIVMYNKKEVRYTSNNVPKTVLKFIQTHNFKHYENSLIFE